METLAVAGFILVGVALVAAATYLRAKFAFQAARNAGERERRRTSAPQQEGRDQSDPSSEAG
jgi:hypothetical protein